MEKWYVFIWLSWRRKGENKAHKVGTQTTTLREGGVQGRDQSGDQ